MNQNPLKAKQCEDLISRKAGLAPNKYGGNNKTAAAVSSDILHSWTLQAYVNCQGSFGASSMLYAVSEPKQFVWSLSPES